MQGRLSVQEEDVPIFHMPAHLGQNEGQVSTCGDFEGSVILQGLTTLHLGELCTPRVLVN